jgi:hypothetical protein
VQRDIRAHLAKRLEEADARRIDADVAERELARRREGRQRRKKRGR